METAGVETTDVETSHGLKTVEGSDPEAITKLLPQSVVRDHPLGVDPPKQPRYLKSVPQHVVPSNNPKAPWGFDENNNPIGMPVPKPSMVRSYVFAQPQPDRPRDPSKVCGGCGQRLCRYCHPENNIQTDVLRGAPVTRALSSEVVEALCKKFREGSIDYASKSQTVSENETVPSPLVAPLIHYPTMFHLSLKDLVEYLNTVVEMESFERFDYTQPKQKILKSSRVIELQIGGLEKKLAEAAARSNLLDQQILDSQNLIRTWSVHVMKLQVKRGERAPDDILDSRTREKFKLEEKKIIKQLEAEKLELQRQSRTDKQRLADLQQRLATWGSGSNPDDFVEEYPRVTQHNPKSFGDKFIVPEKDDFKGVLPNGYKYGVGAYIQLVYEYGDSLAAEKTIFKYWKHFENEVVLQAIGWRLIRPPKKLFAAHPTLTKYVNPALLTEEEHIDSDDTENALILKTGGAQIGGQVYSAGRRWDGTQRSLHSFDGPIGRGTGETVGDGDENHAADLTSNDSESYQPD